MSWYQSLPGFGPEHGPLAGLVRDLTERAERLRVQSAQLAARTAQMRWHSLAASTFRRRADELAGSLRRAAGAVDGAAHSVAAHAARARTIRNEIHSVESALAGGVRAVGRGVDAVLDAAWWP